MAADKRMAYEKHAGENEPVTPVLRILITFFVTAKQQHLLTIQRDTRNQIPIRWVRT